MYKEADGKIPITAKELGRQLGLSQPTVSRILSGAAGHRVAAETRRRVLETAEEMGYRPNAIARSLRRRRTNIVGFYTGYGYLDARNPFQAELIGGLQRVCSEHRMDLLLHGVFRGASVDDIFSGLMDGRVDGLFIHTHADDPLAAKLGDAHLPVVAISDVVDQIPSVVQDDEQGTRLLLDQLWNKGHRRIAYLRPGHHFSSVERRVNTFCAWTEERGMDAGATPIFELDFEFAESALDKILAMPPHVRPTAVCCWNDMTAYDLLLNCRNRGIAVPEQLAIVGFDGLLSDSRLTPRSLSTVGASWRDMTDHAMNLMVRMIEARSGKHKESEIGHSNIPLLTCVPVSLVPGDTI